MMKLRLNEDLGRVPVHTVELGSHQVAQHSAYNTEADRNRFKA